MSDKQEQPSALWHSTGWDGLVPFIALFLRAVLPLVLERDLAEFIPLLVVTPAVALVRTYYANRQIKQLEVDGGFYRKVLIAGAIVALMMFEGLSIALMSDTRAPAIAWISAGTLYIAYLISIKAALRPRSESAFE